MSWDYVLTAAVWSVFGFIIGVLVGRLYWTAQRIEKATVKSVEKKVRRNSRGIATLGVVVMVLAGISVTQLAYFSWERSKQQECLHDNFAELSVALDARSKIEARQLRASQRINLAELRVSSNADFLRELRWYDREIHKIEEALKRNPLPPYPPGDCG